MAPTLVTLTPKKLDQQLSFDTASLNGSSSPAQPSLTSSPRQDRLSPRKFTFTPQRTKTHPRAWERRPATPYLARNEAQKIWKRVPLGSITSNPSNSWNKADRGPITRPVKRLKITQLDEDEDKENIDFVASKWDEDRKDTASPKRKVTGFTAINREGITACYVRETAVLIEAASATALCDDVTTDSNCTENEDLEGPHGEISAPSSVLFPICDATRMESPDGEDLDLQSTDSADEPIRENAASESNATSDASLLAPRHSNTSELYALQAITTVAEGLMMPAPTEISNIALAGEDDTAFLHDFLSRARAQKATRQQPDVNENQQQIPGAMDIEEECPSPASPVEDIEDIHLSGSPPEPGTTTLQPDVQTENIQLSPCRRSSRLNTRLPRLQKPSTTLPNSIALKRLTGAEFISQKETQSVALMTRSNTKRNKGVAKSVHERLIQLDAEAKARDPTAVPVENRKKRRRKAKEVTWAVQLTRFQDDTPVLCSTEEPAQAAFSIATDPVKEKHPESALESEGTRSEEEKKQVRKVRKLRKLNVGTYNGTPAPKKTISLPVPVAPTSTFSLENCKQMLSAVTSELATDNVIQPEVKMDLSAASMKSKPPPVGSEKRFQTRMRTRNKT
ncbi:uncharacterized protein A1O9_05185 [Exophiala aquamarina CBS 119918]|uniref:Uncharacterized protein n=1 Tax=Exophiala aquamarina CBS 119918 TaxID=1182545 RepID=A0A072PDD3_9EURO|nr:uncharacterized protein A1O9_05185 [Exophiala aquamarina CBS 119918]KEF57268.1 hypothetical protein A1O9_05185 [Exophiala aquamarina CBS 119918]